MTTSIRLVARRAVTRLAVPLLVGAAGCGAAGPGATAARFLKATAGGRITEARALLSTRFVATLGEDKTRTVLERGAAQARERGGLRTVAVQRETEQGELAEVVLRSTFGNGSANVDTLQLVKEERRWKVDPRLRK